MTNNELLRADLLDIIFDKRNKDYGAYALRRNYQHRLLMAMGAAAAIILVFLFLTVFGKRNELKLSTPENEPGIILKTYTLPEVEQPEEPRQPARPRQAEQTASQQFTSEIAIRPEVNTTVASQSELQNRQVGTETTEGLPADGIVRPVEPVNNNGEGDGQPVETQQSFIANEQQPEFPGGPDALMRFLRINLNTPDDLQAGEKKMVQVKFKIDKDGSVSEIHIIQSGGAAFDREVIRVCKKMPRWTPAFQNGVHVPVGYVLPVTFIGVEEE